MHLTHFALEKLIESSYVINYNTILYLNYLYCCTVTSKQTCYIKTPIPNSLNEKGIKIIIIRLNVIIPHFKAVNLIMSRTLGFAPTLSKKFTVST
jgi:hypothetical protein